MKPDATALATVLVAATDGLKDLSDIVDPPSRARRGFERRLQHLTELVESLSTGGLSGRQRVAHDVVAAAVVGAQVEVAVVV
jgi:hypothetical protein